MYSTDLASPTEREKEREAIAIHWNSCSLFPPLRLGFFSRELSSAWGAFVPILPNSSLFFLEDLKSSPLSADS